MHETLREVGWRAGRVAVRVTVLLVLLSACASDVATTRGAAPTRGRGADAVPIGGFVQVDDGLYRGAQPDAAGFRALREMGVRTVVNLRSAHHDGEAAAAAGLAMVEIPMVAFIVSDPPTDEQVATFFDVALDPARRPVFVHCAHGVDRTGTMCALYRMEVQGWSPEQALDEMHRLGFHRYYQDLEEFVSTYEPRGFAAAAAPAE